MFKIAWRNLWRHKTRTSVSMAAIALTFGIWLWTISMNDYTYGQMEDAAAQAAGGSVLVQPKGYQNRAFNDVVMPDGDAVLSRLRETEGVRATSGRVLLTGLVSTSSASFAVQLSGVDPQRDTEFRDLKPYITSGSFLAGEEEAPIVLGSKAVRDMELELGDRVVVTASGADGEMQRALFHLAGVLHTGSNVMDEGIAYSTLDAVRDAFRMNTLLHQIGLLPEGELSRYDLEARVRQTLGEGDYEVLTWDQAMPDLVGLIEMDKQQGAIFAVVLFMVVLISILNTFMMVVMERVREFGLLSAIGLRPGRIARLLLFETSLLALVSIGVGMALGFLGHLYVSSYGIDMAMFYEGSIEVAGVALTDTMIYSEIDPQRWLNAAASVFFMVLLSAAYPAYKAAKLAPAEAMRFYE